MSKINKLKNLNAVKKFDDLIEVLNDLLGPKGCEWDRAQTSTSLVPYLLEETYEVIEAIEDNNPEALKEELGDLTLHVLFQAKLAENRGDFTLVESLSDISQKLIRRHPQVFNGESSNTSQSEKSWELAKQKEKKRDSLLDGVPKNLPALARASRIQEKAASVDFDWKDINLIWDKVFEEISELKEAIKFDDKDSIADEIGDVFFSLVNLSRFLGVNSEDSLRKSISKFESRFSRMENEYKNKGLSMKNASLEELDKSWEDAKK